MNAKFDLTGKVAIVTGGGRGIGRAVSLGLAQSGASVVVASRTPKEVEGVAEEIKKMGGKALAMVTDLTVNDQLENLVNATVKEFGRIDILVNNAARSFLRSLLDLREDGWDKVFNTNRHSGESRNPESHENPGFRVALRPEHHAVQGFACPE
jgi:NAD(P)-dependent dehydrogenase (short-subunit alcohol dehydrogenase family)